MHNYGTHQLGGRDMNLPDTGPVSAANPRPVAGFSTVTVMQNFSKSWYDSLETQLRTRFKHVENVLISHTLSRTFRDGVFTPYTVNVNIVSSSFPVRNGARPARQLQWGARYVF